jgi:hypothetical protein
MSDWMKNTHLGLHTQSKKTMNYLVDPGSKYVVCNYEHGLCFVGERSYTNKAGNRRLVRSRKDIQAIVSQVVQRITHDTACA